MSKATIIGDQLLRLVQGKDPGGDEFESETFLDHSGLPASRNKFLACNSAVAMREWRRGKLDNVKTYLDWWEWFAGQPFTAHEELTPEEAYRTLQAYASLVAAALALLTNHRGYEKILDYSRAHVAWCILGSGTGPGRKVRNHHLDKTDEPVVLIGDGGESCPLPYVAQAGMRGWIRSREKNQPKTFLFAERVGLSVMVAQALGVKVKRGLADWQSDLFVAVRDLAPGIPPWGFSPSEVAEAKAFMGDPANASNARAVFAWIGDFAPQLPFTFVRYVNGSVVSLCRKSGGSSTDACMIDKWEPGGRTEKTSADDGLRESSSPQRGFEDDSSFLCQFESGHGPVMRIAKPVVAEAWRATCDLGFLRFESGGWISQPTPVPVPAPTPTPPKSGKSSWMERMGI